MKQKKYMTLILVLLFTVFCSGGEQAVGEEKPVIEETSSKVERIPYSEVRIKEIPFAVQCWTFRKFSFFETLEKVKDLGIQYLEAYPGQMLDRNDPDVKMDHNLNEKQREEVKKALREHSITLVSYGVVHFDNTEESMGKVFEFAKNMGIQTIVTEPAFDDFSLLEEMVKKYNIKIAIHNHPEPSKYARPETVLDHVKGLDDRIGACADTGHWMRTGVNPVEALRLLEGRIIDVHLKDLNQFGDKKAYDVPFGQGEANIHDILAELTLQNYSGVLAVEHENPEEVNNPSPSVKKGIQYVDSITYYKGYEEILAQSNGRFSKHGWNHYGPGYFILDEQTGILKSQGGMGLFWYSRKAFEDFILELDFKCAREDTNSGIFLRIPEVPVSNSYIYHSFEIQIYDAGEDIHKTGAVYDAEAPTKDASKETGEWNHFKITLQGDQIQVELNGETILDWTAEPRGKVRDFADKGYIGLQNHDSRSPVYFRNIFIKEIK
ncbi:MAG TPA: family 16 glycoside hydrolase [Acidobacteriota bacterium]|nr:family 16 glycoside hydrolase [Acidobacteriota bacterium]